MKSFCLYYKYKADANKVHAERSIEMLLEKFGCKIVDRKTFSYRVDEILKADEDFELCDYRVIEAYLFLVKYDEEKVTNEDIEILMLLLGRAFGNLVTITNNDC